MPYLRKMALDEVSFVDSGAGESVEITLFKRAAKPAKVEKAQTMEKLIDQIAAFLDAASPEMKAAFQAALAAMAEGAKPAGEDKPKDEAPPAADVPPAMAKRFDEFAKRLEDIAKENVDLKKQIAATADARETESFQAIAKSMSYVPGMPTERMAAVLKSASHSLKKEEYEDLVKTMRSTDAAIRNSAIFKSIGSPQGSNADDPVAKTKAAADEISKAHPEIGKGRAMEMATQANKDLYTQHLKNQE
jgi:hypothetical protein